MEKCRSFILALLVSLVSMTAYAQDFVCSGVVVDESGEPIIGASVFQKGSSKGAVSDLDGAFKLAQVPEGSTITISYIGYKTSCTRKTPRWATSLSLATACRRRALSPPP